MPLVSVHLAVPAHDRYQLSHVPKSNQTSKQDLASAERLAAELQEYLKEEEIYRVDHYMVRNAFLFLVGLG